MNDFLLTHNDTNNTTEGEKRIMNLEQIKYHSCTEDDGEGVLLVDVDETEPETDEYGNMQYYCMNGHHTFSVDEDEDEDY